MTSTFEYICEKHFRGQRGKSMFTNLRALNHFGRPNLELFLKYVQRKHARDTEEVGVFSCGPASLNSNIRSAVGNANRSRHRLRFIHRHETFN